MKTLVLILSLFVAGVANAAATATSTITPTFTPTPTYTPSPIAAFNTAYARDYVYPNEVWATNGVVLASAVTTPLPGDAAPWVAQVVSRTAFVMSTGSAKVRFSWGVPNDYKVQPNLNGMNVWAYCSTTATAAAFTVTLNVSRNPMNNLLPSGGIVYPGTATSITSVLTNTSITGKVIRAKIPMSSSARFQPGDHVSFDLQRSGGATTDLYVYRMEIEYLWQPYRP